MSRRRVRIAVSIGIALAAILITCRGGSPHRSAELETPDGPAWFEDVTARCGINFVHDAGEVDRYLMYQSIGSGCAIHDLDGDARADLVLLNNAGPKSASTNKLYRQKPDGTFEDVTAGSGLDFPGWNMGIAIGDVNNDGKPDVVVTQAPGVRLLINRGGMKFADSTAAAGLDNPFWGASAAMLDYDRDGWLDLVVVNYVQYDPTFPCLAPGGERDYCAPRMFPGAPCKLFRNRGDGTFEDASARSRIIEKTGPGLGVAVADFDGDGWPDIFVANDGTPNHLWMNRRDGTFRDEAEERGAARTVMGEAFAGMGVALGDLDNDGLLDLFVTHQTNETNTFWKQGPAGKFRDRSTDGGLTATRWRGTGFGTTACDFNHDGLLDLAVVNGRVSREPIPKPKPGLKEHWQPYGERNQLFVNQGDGKFRDASHNHPALCGFPTVARGLAFGDVDGDGAPDLLINACGERARLLRNVAPERGNWLAVRAIDPKFQRDAIGAAIEVAAGGKRYVRLVASSDSFLSAGPVAVHFGLKDSSHVESVTVSWPDGEREVFAGGTVNRRIELVKGSGRKP